MASEAAAPAALALRSPGKTPIWRVVASSAGVWGNDLDVSIRETHAAQTLTDPLHSAPEASVVGSVTGFQRGTHVRLSQHGAATIFKVVSDVDAVGRRLVWRHPRLELRLPYDADLIGFDPNVPVLDRERRIHAHREALRPAGPRLRATLARPGARTLRRDGAYAPSRCPGAKAATTSRIRPSRSPSRNCAELPLASVDPIETDPNDGALTDGADGLALLTVNDFIGDPFAPADGERRGLRALEFVDEVAVLAVPDINIQPRAAGPVRSSSAVRARPVPATAAAGAGRPAAADRRGPAAAVLRDRRLPCPSRDDRAMRASVATASPFSIRRSTRRATRDSGRARSARGGCDSNPAMRRCTFRGSSSSIQPGPMRTCGPFRLRATWPARSRGPTSPFGVHKAPANERLVWVQDTTAPIDDATQGALNPEGINAIRPFAGRGIRIFGARTVSSDPDLAVRQRATAPPHDREGTARRDPVGGIRAERSPHARQADAFDLEFPPRDLAERRARGLVGRRGVLREMRRREQPAQRCGTSAS